ncbi:MAG: hypothetical protein H6Q13_604 [Bacteroidetes bacterium]|nr:hypothetical protein [Bacteroidota bacterium]
MNNEEKDRNIAHVVLACFVDDLNFTRLFATASVGVDHVIISIKLISFFRLGT